ncbi:MAG: methionyl-tRNA formyltransferase [Pseudomonadota bacterium]
MRVVFAGTPAFAVPSFEALRAAGHALVGCYTQPDRPSGRGRVPRASPVKQAALDAGVPVYQPLSLKGPEAQVALSDLQPDLMVVVAYGLLLPRAILDTPALGCVNVHASLLPRWRGAAPIQRAILTGDAESGVCVMQMGVGLDTGPVWSRWRCALSGRETASALHDTLADAGAALLIETLPDIASRAREPEAQDDVGATYARKLEKAEARIDWRASAAALVRQVMAFNAWPVAQCTGPDGVIRVWLAGARAQGSMPLSAPGTVLAEDAHGVVVQTGDGLLVITQLQLPGKRQMSAAEFVNGRSLLGHTLA